MKKEQIGEFIRCAKLAIATCEDPHLSMVTVDRDIQQLEAAIRNLSGGEKAPEPVGIQVRNRHWKNEWTGSHSFPTAEETEKWGLEWRYVYTSPPEVAELQKQVQELQATIRKIADQKPRLMQDQDGHEVVCYSPAFNPCKIARDAIAAAPPFTGVPNPDLDLIEKALNLAAGLSLCVTVSEYEKIKSAIAAFKRLKGA